MGRWIPLVLLAACQAGNTDGKDDTDTTGLPDITPCSEETTTLALDEASPLGFSGQEVLDAAGQSTSSQGTYTPDEGGGTTTVSVGVGSRGDAVFHDREVIVDTDDGVEGPAIGADPGCPDWLEVPVTFTLLTSDGKFEERTSAAILAMTLTSLSVTAELDWASLGGTFTFQGIDPTAWDTVSLDVENTWAHGEVSGQVNMNASRDEGGGMGSGMVGPVLVWPSE